MGSRQRPLKHSLFGAISIAPMPNQRVNGPPSPKVYDRYAEGCPVLETEITAALHEKKTTFNWREISVLNELWIMHNKAAPVQMDLNKVIQIDKDEFDLVIKKINYDVEVYPVIKAFYTK